MRKREREGEERKKKKDRESIRVRGEKVGWVETGRENGTKD